MKTYTYGGDVVFKIQQDTGELFSMVNRSKSKKDVLIPHILPDGTEIKTLGAEFVNSDSVFGRIVVDDAISSVERGAFKHCRADEVVWPKSCPCIPTSCFDSSVIDILSNIDDVSEVESWGLSFLKTKKLRWPSTCKLIPWSCFEGSEIESVTNVNHVESIDNFAFHYTNIKEFTWPDNCDCIPRACFEDSSLSSIKNANHVKVVHSFAFANTEIEEFQWFDNCMEIPKSCFLQCSNLKKISNIEHVTKIGSSAFGASSKVKIDMTSSLISTIAPLAFVGVPSKNIKLPYYMDEVDPRWWKDDDLRETLTRDPDL